MKVHDMFLLIATPKLLDLYPPNYWRELTGGPTVLFTDHRASVKSDLESAFAHVEYFANFETNDTLYTLAQKIHRRTPFTGIVALSENDVLRAAVLRKRLDLLGQRPDEAIVFRDKVEMKNATRAAGLDAGKYCRLENAYDLVDFAASNGLPVVVKPVSGRGSKGVSVLCNEKDVESFLASGAISDRDSNPEFMVESFVEGVLYRVDGLIHDGEIRVCHIGRYFRDCLDFLAGHPIGTLEVASDDVARPRIQSFANALLCRALPTPKTSLFHLQVFERPSGEIVLCEVGMRLGGGPINDEVQASSGIDILASYVGAETGRGPCLEKYLKPAGKLSGRIIVPSQTGTLTRVPAECPVTNVVAYRKYGKPGDQIDEATMTNAEIASFVFSAGSETELKEAADKILGWAASEIF